MKSQLTAILFLAASTAAIAQTQVPHDFQSGTPARAADVNANFDTLETAIDANSAAITTNEARISANENSVQKNTLSISQLGGASGVAVYDQNGLEIGKFLNMRRINAEDPVIYVMSAQGYVFSISTDGDPSEYTTSASIAYTGVGCSGEAYFEKLAAAWFSDWMGNVGTVVGTGNSGQRSLYYTIRGQGKVPFTYQSYRYWGDGQCISSAGQANGWRVMPNDEGITGVSDNQPVGYLVMGIPLP